MGNDGKNAAGCEACSTGCPRNRAGGLPGQCGGGTFEGTGVHRVCLSRAGPAAWGIPGKWDQGDPAVGTPPRHGKRGLIGLADGAARRSHGEAVRTGRPRG